MPLLFAGAGVPHGASRAMVHMVDVHATLVELAGGVAQGNGVSLVPVMNRTSLRARDYLSSGIQGDPQYPDDVCVRSLRYKLRRTPTGEEFYDLQTDPGETLNLLSSPALAAKI